MNSTYTTAFLPDHPQNRGEVLSLPDIEANNSRKFSFSEIQNRFDNRPLAATRLWGDFCAQFSEPDRSRGELDFESYHALDVSNPEAKRQRDDEKDGQAWLPATFRADSDRINANVTSVTAFVGDCDNGLTSIDTIKKNLSGVDFFAHTSFSHRPEKPKVRFIVPFSSPIPQESLARVFEYFNALFQNNLDPVGKKPAQLYYLPSCPFDAPFEYCRGVGKIFDPFDMRLPYSAPQETVAEIRKANLHIAGGGLPPPCRDGERHGVILSALGRWIGRGLGEDEVSRLAHEWNAKNIDPWPESKLKSIIRGMFKTDLYNHPERHQSPPWHEVQLPPGYRLNFNGVFVIPEKPEKTEHKISGPVWLAGFTRNFQGHSWGRLVEWIDGEGHQHQAAFRAERFHEGGQALAQDLARDGLIIVPGKERQLTSYLGSFRPVRRLRSVEQLGWLDNAKGELVYVTPKRSISRGASEEHVFQPERHSPTATTMTSRGRLEEWQQNVANPTAGNPLLVFCLSAAFTGPLLKVVNMENGGFHLYGGSSRGKTTAAQVGASVWGCGADPAADAELSYIQRWNTTQNGLEGLAAAHNDGLIVLDEIGTCNAKNFGRVIYDIAGGRGKVAMSADRNLKPVRHWRLLLLSTGEISVKHKIEGEKGTPHAGQLLRLMDIPITNGVVQETHGLESHVFVDQLKLACSKFFGTAGPTFLEKVIGTYEDFASLAKHVREQLDFFVEELSPHNLQPEQKRALSRFALVRVAGELAAEFQILPLAKTEIAESVKMICNAWLSEERLLSDVAEGIEAVRNFILKHPTRFGQQNEDDDKTKIYNLAGYVDKDRSLYLFTPEGLKEATRGYDLKGVCRELGQRGLLFQNDKSHRTSKHNIKGVAERLSLYAIRFVILEDGGGE